MFTAIDHVAIVVPELDCAVRDCTGAGFTVVPGGRHNIGTHNALIALGDGFPGLRPLCYQTSTNFPEPKAIRPSRNPRPSCGVGCSWLLSVGSCGEFTRLESGGGLLFFQVVARRLSGSRRRLLPLCYHTHGAPPATQRRQKAGWISTSSVKTSRRPASMQKDSTSFTAAGRCWKLS